MNKSIVYFNLIVPLLIKAVIPDGRYGIITILTDMVILPTVLILLNIFILVYKIEISFLRLWIFMLIGLLIGTMTGYVIWGISNSRLLRPDSETLLVNGMLLVYYGVVSSIFFVIFQIARSIIAKRF